jgi:hypothetical protein
MNSLMVEKNLILRLNSPLSEHSEQLGENYETENLSEAQKKQ